MATISGADAASMLEKCAGQQTASAASVQVVDAFAVPRVKYDPVRSSFYRLPGPGTLHGTAQVCSYSSVQTKNIRGLFYTATVTSAALPQQHGLTKLRSCHDGSLCMQDKQSVFMDRYLLLQQRIRRNRLFTAPVFGAATAQQHHKHIEVAPACVEI